MVRVRCYVPGCERGIEVTLAQWIHAVLSTWSFSFYVCEPHYGIFDEVADA